MNAYLTKKHCFVLQLVRELYRIVSVWNNNKILFDSLQMEMIKISRVRLFNIL